MQHCNGPTDESLDVFVFSLSLAHSWTTWTSRRLRSAESWTGGYSWPRRFPGWETHIPPHRDTQTHRVVINKRIVFLCNPNGVVLMTNSTEKSHQRCSSAELLAQLVYSQCFQHQLFSSDRLWWTQCTLTARHQAAHRPGWRPAGEESSYPTTKQSDIFLRSCWSWKQAADLYQKCWEQTEQLITAALKPHSALYSDNNHTVVIRSLISKSDKNPVRTL